MSKIFPMQKPLKCGVQRPFIMFFYVSVQKAYLMVNNSITYH